jgi:hypothetical protein
LKVKYFNIDGLASHGWNTFCLIGVNWKITKI